MSMMSGIDQHIATFMIVWIALAMAMIVMEEKMTVKELQKTYPNSVIFIRGFGGYPMRDYPHDFTVREKKLLANMEVETIREMDGKGYFYQYDVNHLVVTLKED